MLNQIENVLKVLSFYQINVHVGPMERDLVFLKEVGLNPLLFLTALKKVGLLDDPKGIFYESPDSVDFFRITEKGEKFRDILQQIAKINPDAVASH